MRHVAVAGDAVIIRGYAAWTLARVLASGPGGLDGFLYRAGCTPPQRELMGLVFQGVDEAGAEWQERHGDAAEYVEEAMASETYLSSADAAAILRVTASRIRQLEKAGKLKGVTISGRLRLTRASVRELRAKRSEPAA